MKKRNPLAILVAIVSIAAVVVLVASFALGAIAPAVLSPAASATSSPSVTLTPDPCSPDNIGATVLEFDKISREFDDAFVLAQNTPAAQLSPVISEMQRIRRNAQDFPAPACLVTLREYQLSFMEAAIDASLALYSSFSGDPNQSMTQEQVNEVIATVNRDMAAAVDYSNKYSIEKARLLGVTLTPSATSAPTPTPSASETPAP